MRESFMVSSFFFFPNFYIEFESVFGFLKYPKY